MISIYAVIVWASMQYPLLIFAEKESAFFYNAAILQKGSNIRYNSRKAPLSNSRFHLRYCDFAKSKFGQKVGKRSTKEYIMPKNHSSYIRHWQQMSPTSKESSATHNNAEYAATDKRLPPAERSNSDGQSSQILQPLSLPIKSSKSPNITWGRGQIHTASFASPAPINVAAREGEKATLPCNVRNLDHAQVSWIRQVDLHILSVGRTIYTSDERFQLLHDTGTRDWALILSTTNVNDTGTYECQVSTKPKLSRPVNLHVSAAEKAEIVGPSEVFIRNGSTISLTCNVKSKSEDLGSIFWKKDGIVLDYDSPRGGISLEMEKTPTRSTTKLFITKARKLDSGIYLCSPQFAKVAQVTVHVVNGEESAAVHTNDCVHHGLSSLCLMFLCASLLHDLNAIISALFKMLVIPLKTTNIFQNLSRFIVFRSCANLFRSLSATFNNLPISKRLLEQIHLIQKN